MIGMQSPMPTCSLRASSAPIAMRPTSVAALGGVVPGNTQLAGFTRSSTLPCSSEWRSSSAPCLRSIPFRLAPTRPIITSPAENRNGAMRTTPGMPASRRWMSSISWKSASPYAWTMRCAFSASTLSWNSRSKPLVTPKTTTSDATPSTTPIVDTVVNTENTRSRNDTTATSPPARMPTTPAVSMMRCRCCGCASANTTKPTADQRQAGHQADRRPARTPAPVQVAEADQPLQAQGEQLGQRPGERDSDGDCTAASIDRAGRNAAAHRASAAARQDQASSAPREGGGGAKRA